MSATDAIAVKLSEALYALGAAMRDATLPYVEVRLGDELVRLAKTKGPQDAGVAVVDGYGGFKKVYRLEDGRAIALPNLDALNFTSATDAASHAGIWQRAIREEKEMSDRVLRAGLEAQQIDIVPLRIGENEFPAMVMPSFSKLEREGMQIRDTKNPDSSRGLSMLFGTPEHIDTPARLQCVMRGLLDDTVTAITHGIPLKGDTRNLVIKDTANTLPHARDTAGLFDERGQQLRYYLFDFSSKHQPLTIAPPQLLDATGVPDRARITALAERYVDNAYDTLMSGIRRPEIEHIVTLRKQAPALPQYDEYNIFQQLDSHFVSSRDDMVRNVSDRVASAIERQPLSERLSKFARPDGSPAIDSLHRADGQAWVDGMPAKGTGFADRLK